MSVSVPPDQPKRWWRFYETASGRAIVKDELKKLHIDAQAALTEAMNRVRRGTHQSHEEEHVEGRLHAVRTTFDGDEFRAIYATLGKSDRVLLALAVVRKKSRKLPRSVLKVAKRRLGDWEARGEN